MEHLFSMQPYEATTENITITVRPLYLDGQSDAIARKFVFAYFIRIENNSSEPVQLLRRHWFIRNASDELREVEGEGVVGQQPLIHPNKGHEYNSYCVLDTFEGTMEGTYLMRRPNGELFYVVVPRFTLRAQAN
jgi:ApaG protein